MAVPTDMAASRTPACGTPVEANHRMRARATAVGLLRCDTAILDDLRPIGDLFRDVLLQICGGAALGSDDRGADLAQPRLDGGRLESRQGRLRELSRDRLRRARWGKDADP